MSFKCWWVGVDSERGDHEYHSEATAFFDEDKYSDAEEAALAFVDACLEDGEPITKCNSICVFDNETRDYAIVEVGIKLGTDCYDTDAEMVDVARHDKANNRFWSKVSEGRAEAWRKGRRYPEVKS